jgi:hypothetical protein
MVFKKNTHPKLLVIYPLPSPEVSHSPDPPSLCETFTSSNFNSSSLTTVTTPTHLFIDFPYLSLSVTINKTVPTRTRPSHYKPLRMESSEPPGTFAEHVPINGVSQIKYKHR